MKPCHEVFTGSSIANCLEKAEQFGKGKDGFGQVVNFQAECTGPGQWELFMYYMLEEPKDRELEIDLENAERFRSVIGLLGWERVLEHKEMAEKFREPTRTGFTAICLGGKLSVSIEFGKKINGNPGCAHCSFYGKNNCPDHFGG